MIVKILLPIEKIVMQPVPLGESTMRHYDKLIAAAAENAWVLLERMLDHRNPRWRDYQWTRETLRQDFPEKVWCQIISAAPDVGDESTVAVVQMTAVRQIEQGGG